MRRWAASRCLLRPHVDLPLGSRLEDREPMHLPLLRIFIIAVIFWLGVSAVSVRAESPPAGDLSYLPELLGAARRARLWEDRYWHILLHYHRGLFGTVRSEQDDPRFFRSPT